MDDQGFNSLATGLTQSLNSYLGTTLSNQQDVEKQKQIAADKAGQEIQTYKAEKSIDASQPKENALTPEMAEKVMPGHGASMVQSFIKGNGRPPTLKEGHDFLTDAANA